MKFSIPAGSTNKMWHVFIQDATSTTGAGKTGLTNSSVTCYYKRQGASTATALTLTGTGTLGTFTSGLFKEIDATNMPGWYEFHPSNTSLDTGANHVGYQIKGSGIVPVNIEVQLDYPSITSALTALKLDKLLTGAVTGSDVTDNSVFAKLVSKSATADWDDYVNTTDSLQAIRDHGDDPATGWVGEAGPTAADIRTELLTAVLTMSPSSGASAPTLQQALVMLLVKLGVFKLERSGSTVTGYGPDETTVVMTWNLDNATTPMAIDRAS